MKNLKRTSIFGLIIIILTPLLFVSCNSDEAIIPQTLDLSKKVLKLEDLKLITQNISNYQKEIQIKRIDYRTAEEEMQEILQPLVENGEELHSEMIVFLEQTGEFDNLTDEEKEEILNLDAQQLADLSFVMSNAYDARISMDPHMRACLSTAIGITAIYDLVANTAALGTVQTTIGAIRLIGRRYLGWIGVGLMVMDFMDCYYGN